MWESGSSPAQAAIAPQSADVAVVVGAEQVDATVEATRALVEVVGGVARRSRSSRRPRTSTRSRSSAKSVVRSQTAPSDS